MVDIGHQGKVIDTNIEGRAPEKESVRVEGIQKSKNAGTVGATNVSHVA